MNPFLKATALAAATASLATAVPATAATPYAPAFGSDFRAPGEQTYEHGRDRYWDRRGYRDEYRGHRNDYRGDYRSDYRGYRESSWRGRDGRHYCRKKDGTTGLLIGGAAGALLGREIDGGYDRTAGTVVGGVVGALLGREVARGGNRCR